MARLSENLSRHEFLCSCGCGFDTVDVELVDVIQDVCDHFETRVDILSGARCFEYNRSVGSNDNSQHPLGKAADCHFHNVSPVNVQTYLIYKYLGRYGFGVYTKQKFNHIDTRTNGPARWRKP